MNACRCPECRDPDCPGLRGGVDHVHDKPASLTGVMQAPPTTNLDPEPESI